MVTVYGGVCAANATMSVSSGAVWREAMIIGGLVPKRRGEEGLSAK